MALLPRRPRNPLTPRSRLILRSPLRRPPLRSRLPSLPRPSLTVLRTYNLNVPIAYSYAESLEERHKKVVEATKAEHAKKAATKLASLPEPVRNRVNAARKIEVRSALK